MRIAMVGVILLLLCTPASAQPTEGPEFEATKNLVVMIEGKLGEAPTQGAGIVFANQGGLVYIATAFHAVRRGENRAADLQIRFAQSPSEDLAAEAGAEFHLNRLAQMAAIDCLLS